MTALSHHLAGGERTSARRLEVIRRELSGRDVAIVGQVAELRLMNARQIEAVFFDRSEHASAVAAGRAARRTLERLAAERLLVRLDRRIGGLRAGSAGFVYALGPVGQRLLQLEGPRRRSTEPGLAFVAHTLAISQLVVDLTLGARRRELELGLIQAEPVCWRALPGLAGSVVRPDLHVVLTVEEYDFSWFIEVDLGSEHLPTLLRRCQAYEAYYRSGVEQAEHGIFPRVLWLMHSSERAVRLRQAIAAVSHLTPGLFVVSTIEQAAEALSGRTA